MKKSNPYEIERTERRISAASSIAMCALTVVAQIAVTLLLAVFLRDKATIVYVVLEWIGAAAAIWVYRRPGSPSYKLAWMCLLLAVPVAGILLFLFWVGTHLACRIPPQAGLPAVPGHRRPVFRGRRGLFRGSH